MANDTKKDAQYYIDWLKELQERNVSLDGALEELAYYLVEHEHYFSFEKWAKRMYDVLLKTDLFTLEQRLEIVDKNWHEAQFLEYASWWHRFLYKSKSFRWSASVMASGFLCMFLMVGETYEPHRGAKALLSVLLFIVNVIIGEIPRIPAQPFIHPRRPFILSIFVDVSVTTLFVVAFGYPYFLLKTVLWISIALAVLQIITWDICEGDAYEEYHSMDKLQRAKYIDKFGLWGYEIRDKENPYN